MLEHSIDYFKELNENYKIVARWIGLIFVFASLLSLSIWILLNKNIHTAYFFNFLCFISTIFGAWISKIYSYQPIPYEIITSGRPLDFEFSRSFESSVNSRNRNILNKNLFQKKVCNFWSNIGFSFLILGPIFPFAIFVFPPELTLNDWSSFRLKLAIISIYCVALSYFLIKVVLFFKEVKKRKTEYDQNVEAMKKINDQLEDIYPESKTENDTNKILENMDKLFNDLEKKSSLK